MSVSEIGKELVGFATLASCLVVPEDEAENPAREADERWPATGPGAAEAGLEADKGAGGGADVTAAGVKVAGLGADSRRGATRWSLGGGVVVEAEQVIEALLGGVGFGEHSSCFGSATF